MDYMLLYLTYFSKRDLPTVLEKNYAVNTTVNFSLKKFIIILFSAFLIFTCFIILITNNLDSNVNHILIKALALDEHLPPSGSSYYQGLHFSIPKFGGSNIYSIFGIAHSHNQYSNLSLYCLATFLIIAFILYKAIKHIVSPEAAPNDMTIETKSTFLQEDLKKDIKNVFSNFNLNLSNKAKLRKK